jgi:uroporphyrinogen-III synthase
MGSSVSVRTVGRRAERVVPVTRPPLSGFSVMVLGAPPDGALPRAFAAAGARTSTSPDQRPAGAPPGGHRWDVDAVVVADLPAAVALVDACRPAPAGGGTALRPDDVAVACTDPDALRHLTGAGLAPFVAAGPDPAVVGAVADHLHATRLRHVRTHAGLLEVRGHEVRLDGDPLPLSPVPMALLRVLSRSPGEVVDRHRLLATMPGASDLHAVEVAVARLRAGIGRAGVVETVVKRGYRLAVLDPR